MEVNIKGSIASLEFARPEKANAIDLPTLHALDSFFSDVPADVKVVILSGRGKHFCAGLDLTQKPQSSAALDMVERSRRWHSVTEKLRFSRVPIIVAMQGAVLGGGLEIAASCHVRVADESAFFGLPEAERGVFVGGGALVRVRTLIGAPRMTEMMLTNRQYPAADALRVGLCDYVVERGTSMSYAEKLAAGISARSSITNYFAIHATYYANDASDGAGLFLESVTSALVRTTPQAHEGLSAFAEKRPAKFDQG